MDKLNRRNFLKFASMVGLGTLVPAPVQKLFAETGYYDGPYLVVIHASGAWDPVFLCDPKQDPLLNRVSLNQGLAGNIPYAALPMDWASLTLDEVNAANYDANLMSAEAFFGKWGHRALVLNGIDTSTNNHETGTRAVWSGRIPEGYPTLAALMAGTYQPENPLAFISAGGYEKTAGLVSLARVNDTNIMRRLINPNLVDANAATPAYYMNPGVYERIQNAQDARLERQINTQSLPATSEAMGNLMMARLKTEDLKRIQLPAQLINLIAPPLGDLQNAMRNAQLAMSAFSSGLAVAANLSLGGFDTHASHDLLQRRQLAKIMRLVDFVLTELESRGLLEKTTVLVGSDFGRTPGYNGTGGGSGKDHWSITSMMAFGAGVEGNRVIGGTDAGQRPLSIDPHTLQPSATGVRLTPAAIQRALRRKLEIDHGAPAAQFPIAATDLPLFG